MRPTGDREVAPEGVRRAQGEVCPRYSVHGGACLNVYAPLNITAG